MATEGARSNHLHQKHQWEGPWSSVGRGDFKSGLLASLPRSAIDPFSELGYKSFHLSRHPFVICEMGIMNGYWQTLRAISIFIGPVLTRVGSDFI